MAKKKSNQNETPRVNPELEGFDIRIDSFGEIKTNFNIDKINEFLNRNVDDKKLRERDGKIGNDEQEVENAMEEQFDDEDENLLAEDRIEDDAEDEQDRERKNRGGKMRKESSEANLDDLTLEDDEDDR